MTTGPETIHLYLLIHNDQVYIGTDPDVDPAVYWVVVSGHLLSLLQLPGRTEITAGTEKEKSYVNYHHRCM